MKYVKYNQRHIYLIEYTQSIINKFLIGWEGCNNLELIIISDPFSCLWDTFSILTHSPTDDFKHTSIIEMLMKLKKILDGDHALAMLWEILSCVCCVSCGVVLEPSCVMFSSAAPVISSMQQVPAPQPLQHSTLSCPTHSLHLYTTILQQTQFNNENVFLFSSSAMM